MSDFNTRESARRVSTYINLKKENSNFLVFMVNRRPFLPRAVVIIQNVIVGMLFVFYSVTICHMGLYINIKEDHLDKCACVAYENVPNLDKEKKYILLFCSPQFQHRKNSQLL